MLEKIKKFAKARFFIGLVIVGLIFSAFSIMALLAPKKDIIKVDATIVSIEETINAHGDYDYIVLVDYVDDTGIIHRNVQYTAYSSSMKVGDIVVAEYEKGHPDIINPEGSGLIIWLFLVIGLGCVVSGIFMTIRTIKTPESDFNQLDRVAQFEHSEEDMESANNDEPFNDYYFHFCGKLNQSYVLETHSRQAVYEANCEKVSLVKPTAYEFVNHRTGKSFIANISHTVTTRYGSGNENHSFSIPDSSSFKIDGVVCWDYIAQKGYSLESYLEGLKLNFNIYKYGNLVGKLEAAGANILSDEKQYKIDIPAPGVYKVSCKASDIEMVFMCAFITSRVEFF